MCDVRICQECVQPYAPSTQNAYPCDETQHICACCLWDGMIEETRTCEQCGEFVDLCHCWLCSDCQTLNPAGSYRCSCDEAGS